MKNLSKLIPFFLLIIGTLGLLLNEFIEAWGSTATLVFALSNLIGLILLAINGRKQHN